jgi:hypothetical protein
MSSQGLYWFLGAAALFSLGWFGYTFSVNNSFPVLFASVSLFTLLVSLWGYKFVKVRTAAGVSVTNEVVSTVQFVLAGLIIATKLDASASAWGWGTLVALPLLALIVLVTSMVYLFTLRRSSLEPDSNITRVAQGTTAMLLVLGILLWMWT